MRKYKSTNRSMNGTAARSEMRYGIKSGNRGTAMNKQSFISIGLTLNLLTVLLTLAVTACAGPQAKIDWHDTDSYRGWVTDAATGKPIEGAVVVARWHILRPRWSIE